MMPASGKVAIGSSAVTSMSTASVIHQVAITPSSQRRAPRLREDDVLSACGDVRSGSAK